MTFVFSPFDPCALKHPTEVSFLSPLIECWFQFSNSCPLDLGDFFFLLLNSFLIFKLQFTVNVILYSFLAYSMLVRP